MRSHLKVYFSFEDDTQALNDSEKARLLLAMLRYAQGGTESNLTGNERFLFPVFKAQIDRDIETYETKVINGSRGGRPKTGVNQEEPDETEKNRKEPKETETLKIEDRRQKIEDGSLKILDICKPQKRFTPPTAEDVEAYCAERGVFLINPSVFIDYYQSRGWVLTNGKKMVDWKAAVRLWESKERDRQDKQKYADADIPY